MQCHQGHDVAYANESKFFCDCGDGQGLTKCISLQNRKRDSIPSESALRGRAYEELLRSRALGLGGPPPRAFALGRGGGYPGYHELLQDFKERGIRGIRNMR